MAQKAYVLVKVESGKAEAVSHAILGLEGVQDVDLVMGPDDVIVTLEKEDAGTIARMVLTAISRVPGVIRTNTYLVVPLDKGK
jgi:DNA-binding Lrp family transcriptional regulator